MKSETSLSILSPQRGGHLLPARGDSLGWLKLARRLIVFLLGMSVLLIGLVMIVAPGPAIVVIPLGLAILATEFVWARTILEALKKRLRKTQPQAGPAEST